MTEALKQVQQAQLRAAENGISFMTIYDGRFIRVSIIKDEVNYSFYIERGTHKKTVNEIINRINKLL